jgi:hypothetical protein
MLSRNNQTRKAKPPEQAMQAKKVAASRDAATEDNPKGL